ncbi:unnamed protein product [Adineta steineri]|uniref:Fucosyltransferase n=1 Tax=Adineta steineri TaxID=433720 RepID=A0A814UUF8_9BILA|nr:unnamed protein product [Adineta steineri]CAF1388204.1 unnamed protein product [Adineta steineri]
MINPYGSITLMEYRKYFKYFCIFTSTTVLLYVILTKYYTNTLPLLLSYTKEYLNSNNTSITNESKIEKIPPIKEFQSSLSNYHPRLPIHIFTQNLSLIGNTSKLILLGNGFFGDQTWEGSFRPNKTSTEKMTSLYCPFLSNRCDITSDYKRFRQADAVVYHMRDGVDINRGKALRLPHQRFVFALWESPAHTANLEAYKEFFNWTMSYRHQSHVVTSYYSGNAYVHTSSNYYRLMLHENATRKLNLTTKIRDHRPSDEILQKKKLGTAAALISNCGGSSRRLQFVKELQRHIDVKVYGRCGEACSGNMNCREFISQNYYFILSFENSICTDYTTEKFFAALEYPIVPVVFGRSNYSSFIPPSGYIDTRQFSTMISLAKYLNETRSNKEKYLSYFSWKKDYVWGLGAFFTPFCDLCLRLHLDSKINIIDDIHKWWFDNTCESPILPS